MLFLSWCNILSSLTLLPTFRNFSNCLYVSGSSSSETFFIHSRAPRYSVRAASILFIVIRVSDMARYRNVSTSWYRRTRGTLSDNLKMKFQRCQSSARFFNTLNDTQNSIIFTLFPELIFC